MKYLSLICLFFSRFVVGKVGICWGNRTSEIIVLETVINNFGSVHSCSCILCNIALLSLFDITLFSREKYWLPIFSLQAFLTPSAWYINFEFIVASYWSPPLFRKVYPVLTLFKTTPNLQTYYDKCRISAPVKFLYSKSTINEIWRILLHFNWHHTHKYDHILKICFYHLRVCCCYCFLPLFRYVLV